MRADARRRDRRAPARHARPRRLARGGDRPAGAHAPRLRRRPRRAAALPRRRPHRARRARGGQRRGARRGRRRARRRRRTTSSSCARRAAGPRVLVPLVDELVWEDDEAALTVRAGLLDVAARRRAGDAGDAAVEGGRVRIDVFSLFPAGLRVVRDARCTCAAPRELGHALERLELPRPHAALAPAGRRHAVRRRRRHGAAHRRRLRRSRGGVRRAGRGAARAAPRRRADAPRAAARRRARGRARAARPRRALRPLRGHRRARRQPRQRPRLDRPLRAQRAARSPPWR